MDFMDFILNFLRPLNWCSRKFDMEFHFLQASLAQSEMPLLIPPKLGVLTSLECSSNIIKTTRWGETPYQNMSFEGL
jgi:hypothetical protein